MAEEIQYLINQIQKEGVDKAKSEAEKIINDVNLRLKKSSMMLNLRLKKSSMMLHRG